MHHQEWLAFETFAAEFSQKLQLLQYNLLWFKVYQCQQPTIIPQQRQTTQKSQVSVGVELKIFYFLHFHSEYCPGWWWSVPGCWLYSSPFLKLSSSGTESQVQMTMDLLSTAIMHYNINLKSAASPQWSWVLPMHHNGILREPGNKCKMLCHVNVNMTKKSFTVYPLVWNATHKIRLWRPPITYLRMSFVLTKNILRVKL